MSVLHILKTVAVVKLVEATVTLNRLCGNPLLKADVVVLLLKEGPGQKPNLSKFKTVWGLDFAEGKEPELDGQGCDGGVCGASRH